MSPHPRQDAAPDALLEPNHTELQVQLIPLASDQVLIEGDGVPPPSALIPRARAGTDPAQERGHGPGPGRQAGHLHADVLDGRVRAAGLGAWMVRSSGPHPMDRMFLLCCYLLPRLST